MEAPRKKKQFGGLLTAVIIFLVLLGFHTWHNLYHLHKDAEQIAETNLNYANYLMNREMQVIEQGLTDATVPVRMFFEKGDEQEITKLMCDLLERSPYSRGCYVACSKQLAEEKNIPAFLGAIRNEKGQVVPYQQFRLTDEDYLQEWFELPMEQRRNVWAEPFKTEMYQDTIICFSHPVLDADNNPLCLLVEDMPTDWLEKLMDISGTFEGAEYLLVKADGTVILSSHGLRKIPDSRHNFIYYGDVGNRGSKMVLVIPSARIYRAALTDAAIAILVAVVIFFLAAIYFMHYFKSVRAQQKAETERQMMEQAMNVAHEIQMSMVPDRFPPFPERKDLDIYALMQPADEIGGDFYDYFIRNEKLFFCIGDVSGKGVAASLLMSMCRTMFRTLSDTESQPQVLISNMSNGVKELGGRNMFVTLFLGVLDLPTGMLRYCNAGHNPPVILDGGQCTTMTVKANLPAGVRKNYNFVQENIILQRSSLMTAYITATNLIYNWVILVQLQYPCLLMGSLHSFQLEAK